MNFTKSISLLILITSLLLIISTSINSPALETIKGGKFGIFKVYTQDNTSGEILQDNKNITIDNSSLSYDQKFQQQQKEIDKLQNQYNQLIKLLI